MPDTVGYASAVRLYLDAGWAGVLPLARGTKYPPPTGYTGHDGAWPTDTDVEQWAAERPDGNVALRLPSSVVGIDVDHYGDKTGGDTLEALEQARGPLPPTWTSSSRGPGSSGIRFYRIPDGAQLPSAPGVCIEAIQRHHRYAVVAPSVVEGRRYRWYAPDGAVASRPPRIVELPYLPDAWLDGWAPRPTQGITLDRLTPRPAVDRSRAVQTALDTGLRAMRESGGRHDAARDAALALIRLGAAGHPGADDALDQLGWTFRLAIADRTSATEADKEWGRMVEGGRELVAVTPATRPQWDDLVDRPAVAPSSPGGPQEPPGGDEDDPHGWEATDLAPIAAGDHQRPTPSLLRRNA